MTSKSTAAGDDVDADAFVEAVFNSAETCSWCGAPLFREHTTLEGDVLEPAPEAGQAYVPPTEIGGQERRGGKRTYCTDCGRIDAPGSQENRTKRERHEHVANVLDRLADTVDVDVDSEAAHAAVSECNTRDDVTDFDAFAAAIRASLSDE
jgi:uncharacterized Zn finger protein (UPF0148 family)